MLYNLVEDLIPIDSCVLACKYMLANRECVEGDNQVPTAHSFGKPIFLEVLLPFLKPRIEQVWDKPLIPTYVYARVLYPGSQLKRHVDRPSCEYSVTVTLGHNYEDGFDYPIYMDGVPIHIPIGWGATYKGLEIPHWREPLVGKPENFWIQAFFHYVDANGPYVDHAWDKRFA